MISIIICSRQQDISSKLKENIRTTIGVEYELVVLDNSNNDYSIFTAYNKGIEISKFPYLCFVHEDVLFLTSNWGQNLVIHLKEEKTGVIGIAGGRIVTEIPASWWIVGKGYKNLIQHYNRKKTISNESTSGYVHVQQPAIVLDGVFMSMRRGLFSEIRFDESLTGFHGYDHDISIQSYVAGYKNYVVFDILLEHYSEGTMTGSYYQNLVRIHRKWMEHLPLFAPGVTPEEKNDLNALKTRLLGKLLRRLVASGFRYHEIAAEIKYFSQFINQSDRNKTLRYLYLKIFMQRLIKTPQYLLK